ncbi:MAG: secondary thiamine-phosphate synthase enzyme YjbQ [Candidatus Abyssubacteria bacterium]
MSSFRTEITIRSEKRIEIIDISQHVAEACSRSGIRNGIALVFPGQSSSAVYVSDCHRALIDDFSALIAELVPENRYYQHDLAEGKKNAAAHLRAILTGHHVTIPVTDGSPDLGPFQTIYYAEFDGQRDKGVMIKIVGE